MLNFSYLLISAAVSFLLLTNILAFMRRYFLDSPSFRSSHLVPTPRGGGIVFLISPLISYLLIIPFVGVSDSYIFLPYIVLLPVFLVGLLDDKVNLSPLIKFFPQFITCIALLSLKSWSFPVISLQLHHIFLFFIAFFAVVLMVLFVNLINFTDGLDGLVASSCIAPVCAALYSTSSTPFDWFFLGSLITFLFFNWSPAKIFMGDCGSLFIGSYYLLIAMRSSSFLDFLILLSLLSPLLLDALTCLLRRFISRQNIFRAHKQHLFQRLHLAGWSHSRITMIYASFCLISSIALLLNRYSLIVVLILVQSFVGLWLNNRYSVPFDSPDVR